MDLRQTDKIHFIGIGGVSMSALAEALAQRGFHVTGSDRSDSATMDKLRQAGLTVYVGHDPEHVDDADVIFYTSAIPCDNPELARARAIGKRVFHRSDLLAWLMRDKHAIAVAGTHGKTTTSAMLGYILEQAGLDPTVFVGGLVRNWGANYRVGRGPHFVFEACESDASFLKYRGASQIVTGIEDDHLDYYQSSEALDAAFADFLALANPQGFVVWHIDSPRLQKVISHAPARLISYGLSPQANYAATEIQWQAPHMRYCLMRNAKRGEEIHLLIPGEHNVLNSLAAIAAAEALGVDISVIVKALAAFQGTGRRFEQLGQCNGLAVYDDYAHHPTEIQATLKTARQFAPQRLIVIFQPHLPSRLAALLEGFAQAFALADIVIINDVYLAREAPIPGIDGALLADRIRRYCPDKPVEFIARQDEIVCRVVQMAQPGDLILTIGAGDIRRAGEQIARQLCPPASTSGQYE